MEAVSANRRDSEIEVRQESRNNLGDVILSIALRPLQLLSGQGELEHRCPTLRNSIPLLQCRNDCLELGSDAAQPC